MIKYKKIYKDILSNIEINKYKTGTLIPSENDLMEKYSVSRDTVRKSLGLLEQNGYIQKIKGKGSVVLDSNKYDFPVSGIVSFKELQKRLGVETETVVYSFNKIIPDEKIKKYLKCKYNEKVWFIQRIRKINGEAVILDTDVLKTSVVEDLNEKILSNSLYEYIEDELGLNIAYANKEITCKNTTDLDKKLLDMDNYNMVVNIESFVYLDDSNVFQYTISRHRPDKFVFKDFARRMKNN